MSHALYEQLTHSGAQKRPALGGHHGAHHLPAAVATGGALPFEKVVEQLAERFPQASSMLDDVLAFTGFPGAHSRCGQITPRSV